VKHILALVVLMGMLGLAMAPAYPQQATANDSSFVGTWDRSERYGPSKLVFYNNGSGYFTEDGYRYSFSWRLAGSDSMGYPVARLDLFGTGPSGIPREVYWAEISSNYPSLNSQALSLRTNTGYRYYSFVRR
jgi:hypothetical protein